MKKSLIILFILIRASIGYAQDMQTPKVYVSQNEIWIKNTETGELKMIGMGSDPTFSQDGKFVLFLGHKLDKTTNKDFGTICIMSVDGDNVKEITTTDMGNAHTPCWSPDGKKVVFAFSDKKGKDDMDIYMIDITGENLMQLTTNKSADFAPYWTKDNYIYFTSDRGAKSGNYQIWRFKYIK